MTAISIYKITTSVQKIPDYLNWNMLNMHIKPLLVKFLKN